VTFFGLFLTPVFYVVIRWFIERKRKQPQPQLAPVGTVGAVLLVPCLLGLLSGCMVGPDYKLPQTQVPEAFANQTQAGLSPDEVETFWWHGFQDTILQQLVDQALAQAQYEQRVLIALEEMENALVGFTRQQARPDWLQASAQASEKAQNLARQRYQFGMADFLTVLDAERTLLDAQDRLAPSATLTATTLVAIYKALGGG
jgi:outer membrane protein TolC